MRTWVKSLVVAVGVCWAGDAGATSWQQYNTCWADFDVGGGWFCGLRGLGCASPGLYCSTEEFGTNLPPLYSASAPSAKSVTLDSSGYAWLVGTDNKIYNEVGWTQFSPAVPLACVAKIAVVGSPGNNPRILALGCNGSIYRYLDSAWFVQKASGGVDVSVSGNTTLTYLASSSFSYSAPGGGGAFVTLGTNTSAIKETFAGGSDVHVTTLLAGFSGVFGDEFQFCHNPIPSIGTAAFYSFGNFKFLVGDPSGCDHLQVNINDMNVQGSHPIRRAAEGNRGPGSDHIWVLTNVGRVLSLID
jgi:hypothetical protein